MKVFNLLFLAILFVSCSISGYQTSYKSFNDGRKIPDVKYLVEGEDVKLYGVDDFEVANRMALAKGYIPIGKSSFNGSAESSKSIKEQAKRVGATHVLVNAKYTDTKISSSPMYVPSYRGYHYYGGYGGTQVTSERMYNQRAIFFVKKTSKFELGVYFKDLNTESKKKVESNFGAIVDVVVEGTPAFKANLLVGDIILKMNDEEVKNSSSPAKIIDDIPKEKKEVVFEVYRSGSNKTITVVLDR